VTVMSERVVRGLRESDQLYDNKGKDQLYGGKGEDSLFGNRGDDKLFSSDIISQSEAYTGVVDCGPGDFFSHVDFTDQVSPTCELVREDIS
jgi:RTX calcium-binding nonapeptide repeat (4 copies)